MENINPYIDKIQNCTDYVCSGMLYERGVSTDAIMCLLDLSNELCNSINNNSSDKVYLIESIANIGYHITYNTQKNEKFTDEDINSLIKLFEIPFKLLSEVNEADPNKFDMLYSKITCIDEIIAKNMLDMTCNSDVNFKNNNEGKIFTNYRNLLFVIDTVNDDWDVLYNNGFNHKMFTEYSKELKKNMSDDEKIKMLFNNFIYNRDVRVRK